MQQILSELTSRLISHNTKVVTVESCTAGWIGKILTDQPGSSQWFAGGLITYTNESKSLLAKVPSILIEQHGAVSTAVAESMAIGANEYFDHTISVAVSGIAGPDGGTETKPVGTVCIATYYGQMVESKSYLFKGGRNEIRRQTAEHALKMLLSRLQKKSSQ